MTEKTPHEEANILALVHATEELTAELKAKGVPHERSEKALNDIHAALETIAQNTKSPSSTRKLLTKTGLGILKAPFQIVAGTLKTGAAVIGIPALIATGFYTGNGNDPMDIPCNVMDWSNKHFGTNAVLTELSLNFCALAHSITQSNEHDHQAIPDNYQPEYLEPQAPFGFEELPPLDPLNQKKWLPDGTLPYDPFAPTPLEYDA
ncbi:MAG: hypothetical protein ACRBCT_05265 [Alphaproteobacteria bacterium]